MHRRVFSQGQETVAKEVATQLFEEQAALTQRAAQIAAGMIDQAEQLGADGDPFKKRIASLVKGSVVESLAALQRVASGQLSIEEAKEALHDDPFSGSSPSSVSSLPGESAGLKALPLASGVQPQKRGRGRPRKNPPPL
jgi:hypothetical protein